MSDLISRKALINHLSSWQMEQFTEVGHEKEYNLLDMIIRGIENEPSVEPPKGEWEKYPSDLYRRCSVCKMEYNIFSFNIHANYCPHCGADMRKKVF